MTSVRSQRRLAMLTALSVSLFLMIVVVEHLLDSRLDPATHEISEYVHGPAGWLMTIGLLLWSLSLAAAALALRSTPRGPPVAAVLLVAAIGLLLTAAFATQTSAGRLPAGTPLTFTGRMHDVGSGLATIGLLAAVLLSLRFTVSRVLQRVALAVLLLAVPADVALLVVGPSVAGARQRLLVLLACAWELALAAVLSAEDVPDGDGAHPWSRP